MTQDSAVQFATDRRIHMGLAVQSVERSVAFYQILFGQGPTKARPGYAKFEVAEPPVNLSLNQVGGPTGPVHPVAHFGIQVKSTAAVKEAAERLMKAGQQVRVEESVTCCYAVQNKVWAADPDGNKWEVYVVLDDHGAHHHSSQGECCATPQGQGCEPSQSDCCEPSPTSAAKAPEGECCDASQGSCCGSSQTECCDKTAPGAEDCACMQPPSA